jgi:hypothetical protein
MSRLVIAIVCALAASPVLARPVEMDTKYRAWTVQEAGKYLSYRFKRESDGSQWQFMEITNKGCRLESGLEERETVVTLQELVDGFTQADGTPCGARDGGGVRQ